MQDSTAECPMPETFRARISVPLFLACLLYVGFVSRVIFAPLMPAIEQDLGIDYSQAGSLFLMISLGYLLAPFCSGLITSRINHRGALIASAWVIGLALIPFSLVHRLWIVRLLLMFIGLAAGLHLPSAIATITGEIRKDDWGKALGVHQAAPPLSFVSAPLIAAGLMRWFSWRIVLLLMAIIALALALAYTLKGTGGDFPGKPPSPKNVKTLLATPSFYIMVLLLAMAMGGNAGIYAMLPLFLIHERGMDLTWANTLIGLSQVSGLLVVFMGGWITDKVGQKPTLAAALAAAGICTLLLGTVKGDWLVAVIFIQPALLSSFFPAGFAAMTRIAPPDLRSVTSALCPPLAFLIGGGVLPTVIGYLGQTYTFSAGILLAGAFMLVGPILTCFLRLGQYDSQAGC